MVLEYGDALLVVDAGLMFPDDEMLGIDLVLPDFSYIVENQERVLGIVLTHGHEDHVGALPVPAQGGRRAGLRHPADPGAGERQAGGARAPGEGDAQRGHAARSL